MKKVSLLAVGALAFAFASSPALALSARTFVSGAGSDEGVCAVATPCRTFAYAPTQTAPSGEIIVLNSAGYGAVTINKAVSIINTSNFAGVTVASGDGITINAGANNSVTLRGLTVDGGGTGSNGIVYNSGGKLTIDQCDVMNFGTGTANGIFVRPTSGTHKISITNTTTTNNRGEGARIFINNSAIAVIFIDRVTANNNGYGVGIQSYSSGGVAASVSNSIASFNDNSGFFFRAVTASLDASYASSNNGPGVYVYTSATLALGRSVLMSNAGYGLFILDGTVTSYKDNRMAGNSSGPVSATPAAASLY
jgi:hypothetical protein